MILEAAGLSFVRGVAKVLHDVDFRLDPGEVVGLIGPNGAGKTTLLRCLIGLAPPSQGDIRLNGRPLADWPSRARAGAMAYLAQSPDCHWPMSVERVVALGRLPHLDPWQAIAPGDIGAIERAIDATDIGHLRHRPVTALSGGERARVLLARSLAVEAPFLFADEPVAGLDPGHQMQVMELLRGSANSERATVVVLHDLTLAARYCTRLVLLAEGRVVADGPPGVVLTASNLARIYGIAARIETHDGALMVVPEGLVAARRPLASETIHVPA
ncbi:ABC transporter ATP-binding protein [Magnetospirillum molischianum]|uniref:Hemin import ATP-binding protein HmuV n=1 Tax=Magnetospirillum molischianum DSM 120 TaxID=1150626 RepID=H8FUE7_MAGML|nr:ABC transporter ATP-binding protein [Magnetospirillum molischianum]CCG41985.1 Hemin import ATP-binding protein HmuV [Magnetospirillum molischianum DSM 120]